VADDRHSEVGDQLEKNSGCRGDPGPAPQQPIRRPSRYARRRGAPVTPG
jgi:hypothetical protein